MRTRPGAAPRDCGRDLKDKVVVITGGGRGIGRAVALRYATEGAHVMLASRTRTELEATVKVARATGGVVESVVADVRHRDEVDKVFSHASSTFGRVDLAVLSAGYRAVNATLEHTTDAAWIESMQTNLNGTFFGLRAAIPHLRTAGGGKIIVINSAAPRRAPQGLGAYVASTGGVTALVRVAARELRHLDIAVNELQPGPTATTMSGVRTSDPDTLAQRHVVLDEGLDEDQSLAGEWFKSPSDVAQLAVFVATLPNHGPSGQAFSLNSAI